LEISFKHNQAQRRLQLTFFHSINGLSLQHASATIFQCNSI